MKLTNISAFYFLSIFLFQCTCILSYKGAGHNVGRASTEIMQEITNNVIISALPKVHAISADVAINSAQMISATIKDVTPQLVAASANFGQNFGLNIGLGTLMFLSDKIAQAGSSISSGATTVVSAAKIGATVVVTSPITPYVVGGVVVGYGGYKLYYYYNPTTEQKILITEKEAELYQKQAAAQQAKIAFHTAKIDADNAKKRAQEAKQTLAQKLAVTAAAAA